MKKTLLYSLLTMIASSPLYAEGEVVMAVSQGGGYNGWYAISAAIAISLAALGGTLGQARAVAAAMDGIARNPSAQSSMQTPMIIGLALIETLVIFSFVIAILLQAKIS